MTSDETFDGVNKTLFLGQEWPGPGSKFKCFSLHSIAAPGSQAGVGSVSVDSGPVRVVTLPGAAETRAATLPPSCVVLHRDLR